jgi:HSP20 family protein
MIRWLGNEDAFSRLERMQRDMDRLMGTVPTGLGWRPGAYARSGGVYPLMNVYDDGTTYVVHAEVPGVDPSDLDVSVTGNTLTISGERKPPEVPSDASYHRRERDVGTFRRSLTLNDRVDGSRVEAHCENGVLQVRLPRAAEAKPRKVEIATR